ncbi:MAG: helix-hairpin-helix domain-containing protein [Erysipelotrichaceae bacterium]|nr:helix-hairpin-helix domain-containing protein [Erysipelotrichaceae bacterium]
MKKRYQILGMIILIICSIIYDYQKPEAIEEETIEMSYVTLEGEFNVTGNYEFEGELTIGELIDKVGVSDEANLDVLDMDKKVEDESRIYLPPQNNNAISLNSATLEELMTLSGVGEKTAQKIIDYREVTPFECLEDIMNISGIGEKTYLNLRESLCL